LSIEPWGTSKKLLWAVGETTALGEPMPGPDGRRRPVPVVQGGTSLLGLFAAGTGIGLVFALLGRLM
jgi:hypothetical protein